jgi:hypothetical protein
LEFRITWTPRTKIKNVMAKDFEEIKKTLQESAWKDKDALRNEINRCNNKTFKLALSVFKSPDKSIVATVYLEKKLVSQTQFHELEERVSKLENGEGPQTKTQEHTGKH